MAKVLEDQFQEKYPVYPWAQAVAEAERCLYCFEPPCVKACPTAIDIPTFIKKIATNNLVSAAKTILSANILGQSCARVCPVEVLCAGSCVYNELDEPPIAIGRLQRFATEYAMERLLPQQILGERKPDKNKRVALVGSGPASMAAAAMLRFEGFQVTIFEKRTAPFGLNSHGIAPYKLKHREALHEMDWLLSLGIELQLGVEVGDVDVEGSKVAASTLLKNFDAIFLGMGLGDDKQLPVPQIEGPGVMGACDLIERIKTDPELNLSHVKQAHIIGGGNTAIDIAHELGLLGVDKVTVLYRGGSPEMSAYAHEVALARMSGVHIVAHMQVKQVVRDQGRLVGIILDQSNELIKTDLLVVAIGQSRATQIAKKFSRVEVDGSGRIVVDKATYRTHNEKIWSGGDCVNGGKEVVNAVAEAKIAVGDMLKMLGKGYQP